MSSTLFGVIFECLSAFKFVSDPLQPYGCKLFVLLTFHIFIYVLPKPSWVMNINFVHHLPRLIAMVAKSFMCNRKVSNFIFLHDFLIYVNNQGKQHKMLKTKR